MTKLKGMTWNHERGVRPLVEASEIFKQRHGVEISWDARSLSDFELFPLDELASKYDFIMIDHPHIGVAHAENLLIPLEDRLSAEFLAEQRDGSVGKSYESYSWEGHQYAIPLDAAAQVSVAREDLLPEAMPSTWTELFEMVAELPSDKKMAIPFVPVHAYSSFFTLASQLGGGDVFWRKGAPLDEEVGIEVLALLEKIVSLSHPDSKDMDPINMLDRMVSADEIVYSPLVYGYSNYSRAGYADNIVTFRDMPRTAEHPSGSMIGGVGLSISSKCKDIDTAIKFAEMVSVPAFQKGEINDANGQPGHVEAWKDAKVNADSNNFFINTLETLTYGSLRPRFNGYIEFQAQAGAKIREFVVAASGDKRKFIQELNALVVKCML